MEKEVKCIWQASYLMTKGYSLISCPLGHNGFAAFVFQDKNNRIDREIQDYVNGKGKITAKDFVEAYRTLKSLVFKSKEGNENGRKYHYKKL